MKTVLRIVSTFLLLALVAGTLFYLYQRSRPVQVVHKTVSPKKLDIIKKTVASGLVVARREVEIKPQLSGIVDRLLVETGDSVTKGQVIARIKLIPNLLRVNEAEARLKKAQVNLDYQTRKYTRVIKRYKEAFKSGKIRNTKESPHLIKLNQAEAELKTAELNYTDAQKDYERQKKLLDEKIITPSAFEDTASHLEKTRELYQKALRNYEMTAAQTFDSSEAELQDAENGLRLAREELSSALNSLQLIREGISSLTPDESNTLIRSTIDGMVLDIPVKEGSPVIEISTQSPGTTIAVVADMTDMVFEGKVDESEIDKIRIGMDLILTIGAISDAKFKASIEHIAPKGIEQNGSIQFNIRAMVKPDNVHFIRSGYSAGADIVLDKRENVMAVEEGNLMFKGAEVLAEVETQPNTFEKRKIAVGLSDGIHIEVLSGLTFEDRIKVQQ